MERPFQLSVDEYEKIMLEKGDRAHELAARGLALMSDMAQLCLNLHDIEDSDYSIIIVASTLLALWYGICEKCNLNADDQIEMMRLGKITLGFYNQRDREMDEEEKKRGAS